MNEQTTIENITTGDGLERCPMPVPFGWFCVDYSDQLAPGELKIVNVFGKEWVLFRGENGKVGMTDPFCPHLGAHIGHGGKVVGDNVRCPFHHWQFDPEGWCKEIPYAKIMPPVCKKKPILKALPVQERYGAIFAWYHPYDEEPKFDLLDIPEMDAAYEGEGYIEIERMAFEIPTMMQEIVENGVDHAHLYYLHGNPTFPPKTEIEYEGPYWKSDNMSGFIVSESIGPGCGAVRFTKEGITMTAAVFSTPVDRENTLTRWFYTHKDYAKDTDEFKMANRLKIMSYQEDPEGETGAGFESVDMPIWTHKKYRPNPLLCDGDGQIIEKREWFSQFYAEPLSETARPD